MSTATTTPRRIVVKDHEGYPIIEMPMFAGVLAAVVAPVVTAIGAVAALANDWSIEVEREQSDRTGRPPVRVATTTR
jgi:hypothetical protein